MRNLLILFLVFVVIGCTSNKESKELEFDKSLLQDKLNKQMDKWHMAATNADVDIFFGMIADKGVYIGTDKLERWTKEEFYSFSKPHFDKGKAWDFKVIERNWDFSPDRQIAWFDELLNTWMGVCRSSGIMMFMNDKWEILHYHLSITVPNDVVHNFVSLVDNYEEQEEKKGMIDNNE